MSSNTISPTSFCISNPPIIRLDIYSSWVSGLSETQALRKWRDTSEEDQPEYFALVQSQYRLFEAFEQILRRPRYFSSQLNYFSFPASVKLSLIESYFTLDEDVVKELIGKRIVGKTRRDLDDISLRRLIPLASCRRQFDNIRSIMRSIEETPAQLYQRVQRHFLLPEHLARFYVGIIFLNHHLIDVSQHKSVQNIPLKIPVECAHVFIEFWTVKSNSLHFNSSIAHHIRDFQSHLQQFGRDQWTSKVISFVNANSLCKKLQTKRSELLEIIFNVLKIGSGLVQSQEIRDLFVDIIELIVHPLKSVLSIKGTELDELFNALSHLIDLTNNSMSNNPTTKSSWLSLLTGLCNCTKIIISS